MSVADLTLNEVIDLQARAISLLSSNNARYLTALKQQSDSQSQLISIISAQQHAIARLTNRVEALENARDNDGEEWKRG